MAHLIRPVMRRTAAASSSALCKAAAAMVGLSQTHNPTATICRSSSSGSSLTGGGRGGGGGGSSIRSEMRKSAFQDKILRLLRYDIQYELDRSPPKQPVTKFHSFTVNNRPGEQWITLKRNYGENEEIKIEATMVDGSIPIPKSGNGTANNDVQLHITMIVSINKGDGDNLEFMCSAWPDSIEITKLFIRKSDIKPDQAYDGPDFEELDDELQDSLYSFLAARQIDDEMASFLHEFMENKERSEFIRWLGVVKSYLQR